MSICRVQKANVLGVDPTVQGFQAHGTGTLTSALRACIFPAAAQPSMSLQRS
jgi:hypothetical protein